LNEDIFRVLGALILFTGIGISSYFRRKADRETGEKLSRKADGSLLMNIIRLGGLILWLTPVAYLINPQWLAWAKTGLPEWARWLGVGLGVLCTFGIYWLFSSIGSGITPVSATRKEHKLSTTGPYRFIRHPLYTFGTTFFLAFGLISDIWLIMLFGVFTFIVMAIRTPIEEANLIEKFGDEYREYMKRTGRYLPRLF